MKDLSVAALREMAADIDNELQQLKRLEQEISQVNSPALRQSPYAHLVPENLAFKLHNFYTGCERIFQIIASELNGSLPTGYDWRKRLLSRLSTPRQQRPAVISENTAQLLEEFLAFRHVVRHLYGFELSSERIDHLVKRYPEVWQQFEKEITVFIGWLKDLAAALET